MAAADTVGFHPYPVELAQNETIFWCACGLTNTQPFCDGTHKGTGIKSLKYTALNQENVVLCGCKKTKNPPFCDGSHSQCD